jgi:hypothetical protein
VVLGFISDLFYLAKMRKENRKDKTQKETVSPKGRGDGRPNGLSHYFFSVTNIWKNVCGNFIIQGQQLTNLL